MGNTMPYVRQGIHLQRCSDFGGHLYPRSSLSKMACNGGFWFRNAVWSGLRVGYCNTFGPLLESPISSGHAVVAKRLRKLNFDSTVGTISHYTTSIICALLLVATVLMPSIEALGSAVGARVVRLCRTITAMQPVGRAMFSNIDTHFSQICSKTVHTKTSFLAKARC
jgi:hypothetical protein